jgi:hypothetical protein
MLAMILILFPITVGGGVFNPLLSFRSGGWISELPAKFLLRIEPLFGACLRLKPLINQSLTHLETISSKGLPPFEPLVGGCLSDLEPLSLIRLRPAQTVCSIPESICAKPETKRQASLHTISCASVLLLKCWPAFSMDRMTLSFVHTGCIYAFLRHRRYSSR